jgi:hypothetical protein
VQFASLQEESELFTSTKMDQPNRLKLMPQEALKALESISQKQGNQVAYGQDSGPPQEGQAHLMTG